MHGCVQCIHNYVTYKCTLLGIQLYVYKNKRIGIKLVQANLQMNATDNDKRNLNHNTHAVTHTCALTHTHAHKAKKAKSLAAAKRSQ